MTRAFATAVIVLTLGSSAAFAQHRAGDAALGALSGAVVLGPIGAVAGAVVGYTAGAAIAHSWGLREGRLARSRRRSDGAAPAGPASARAARQSAAGADPTQSNARVNTAPANVTASMQTAQSTPATAGKPPPVQALE